MNISVLPRLNAFNNWRTKVHFWPFSLNKSGSPRRDMLILGAAATLIFALVSLYDPMDWMIGTLRQFDHLQLDRILMVFFGLNILLPILFVRRWLDLLRETARNRETTAQLLRERQLLRTLIDNLPDYIFIKDSDGRFIVSNVAHASAAQMSPEAIVGKTAFEVFPEELAARFHNDDQAIVKVGAPLVNAERTTVDATGRTRVVLTTKVPLRDTNGQVIGLVGISRDITERKESEERALELAREKERVRLMSSFMHDASHDFRTPLATISTSLYLLLKSDDNQSREKHSKRIEQQITRLTRLIDGLNTMTWLDSQSQLELRSLDMNEMAHMLTAQHPRLQLDLAADLPSVQGDEHELYQALRHLVDNAVQFSPADKEIRLRTALEGSEILFEVRDSGAGIQPKDLPHIFERFYRADQSRSTDSGGIGLGLSIARKIVELHGGRIEVESVPGAGSLFRVVLPASQD